MREGSIADLTRAIRGQPGKSLRENIEQGTAYVLKRRKRVKKEAHTGEDQAERITVVGYDISGSMSGDPARFQAGLISAFTALALSDVTRKGKHRHRVVLIPFNSEVGEPKTVTNATEALELIADYRAHLERADGGTSIQKFMLQAMALIADAQKRAGEPLAGANIVVMTDGQADIKTEELVEARSAISRKTPLQSLFVAIGDTNEELKAFVRQSHRAGFEKGFYREFTDDQMKEMLARADSFDPADVQREGGAFYSDKRPGDLSGSFYRLLDRGERLARRFAQRVDENGRHMSAGALLRELDLLDLGSEEEVDRPLERWLTETRGLLYGQQGLDRKTLERVVDDLWQNFDKVTRVQRDALGRLEQGHLRHLLEFAAGRESLESLAELDEAQE
jgi:Mg-chelatase subunit ChlD